MMSGVWLLLGVLSFGVMALSDWIGITPKARFAGAVFVLGCSMLALTSVGLLLTGGSLCAGCPFGWCIVALLLGLLVYTVFVAVHSSESSCEGQQPLVCTGVYALCRHPGVLWLAGLYFFVWVATGCSVWAAAWILFSAADIVYVLWQDRYLFPRTIQRYGEYQKQTPFLIPNVRSIRKCLQTLQFSVKQKNKRGDPKNDL